MLSVVLTASYYHYNEGRLLQTLGLIASSPPMNKHIYSVSGVINELRELLEGNYTRIWVEGEISNLSTPPSGHLYFSLKEDDSLIRCVQFRQHVRQPLANGTRILVGGRFSIYEARGDLQIIVSYIEASGQSALHREFERLKQQLDAEGLFSEHHKQPIPQFPRTIGIISSPSGAALHDICATLKRRYLLANLIVYPTLVQGPKAVDNIIDMLNIAERRQEVDVILLARGGGSAEDLQAFNHERVVRAIFDSTLPIISAIGHETDFTLADMVADLRASTPTTAAEAASPEFTQLHTIIHSHVNALCRNAKYLINRCRQKIDHLLIALYYQSPQAHITRNKQTFLLAHRKLHEMTANHLSNVQQLISTFDQKLKLMSPQSTLKRGYAILQDQQENVVIDATATWQGEILTASVARGKFRCIVDEIVEK